VTDSKASATRVFTIRAIAKNIIVKVGPIKDKDGKVVKGATVTLLSGTDKYTNTTDSKGIAYISVPGQLANQPVDITVKKAGYKDKTFHGSSLTDGTFNPVNGYPRIESKQGSDYIFLVIVIVVLLVLALVLFSMKRPTNDDSTLDDDEKEPGEEALSEEE